MLLFVLKIKSRRFCRSLLQYQGGQDMNEKENLMRETPQTERKYKDKLFRLVFHEKKELLSLYNAVNGTNYDNPEDLEVNTLENAVYMNMKNDISFVFDMELNLYEHQSTYNPNMPLRDLFYIARLLEKATADRSLYGISLVQIPTPRFVVFYNGTEEQPERQILRLSDAFEKKIEEPEIELKVLMLNINLGKNKELLKKCKTLREYMIYVTKVREYAVTMNIRTAVERAVNECIKQEILKDFLLRYKAEAIQMSIFEYDEEREMQLIKESMRQVYSKEGREEGRKEGLKEGLEQGLEQGIKAFILDNLEEENPKERILEKLQRHFELSKEQSEMYFRKYSQ